MTQEEKAFYEATEEAWGVQATTCSSPSQVASMISNKMRELGYPIWCLEEVDNAGIYDIIKKYINLVQSDGKTTHNIAIEIGKIVGQRPSLPQKLKAILTAEKCKEGMMSFLSHFEEGRLIALAKRIGAEEILPSDIKSIFNIKHSALWIADTGETEIKKLIVDYEVISQSNVILNVSCNTKEKVFAAWKEALRFIGFSCDTLKSRRPALEKVLSYLLKIVNKEDILPEMMREFLDELKLHKADIQEIINRKLVVFNELYSVYLDGFNDLEKEAILNSIQEEMFTASATSSNQYVKQAAETYRKNQIKTQLFNKWKELTGTKTPKEWAARYQTPILCLVDASLYSEAKRAFSTLNSIVNSDIDIHFAIEFLESNEAFFTKIKDANFRDEMFIKTIIGEYSVLLSDVEKVRQVLESLAIDAYDWVDSPLVKQKIQALADAEYYAGGSDKAVSLIDGMSDAELKQRLKELVQKDIELGVKIIRNGGK